MTASEENRAGFKEKLWQVHKFGGTSVANAECFLQVASIVEEQLGISQKPCDTDTDTNTDTDSAPSPVPVPTNKNHLAIVVSAVGGGPKTTDLLLDSVSAAATRDASLVSSKLDYILTKHDSCLDTLLNLQQIDTHQTQILKDVVRKDIKDILDILKTVSLIKWQAERISELVSGYGETWSAQILNALLTHREINRRKEAGTGNINTSINAQQQCFRYLDARRVITIDEENGAVCWDISKEKLNQVYQEEYNAAGMNTNMNMNNNNDNENGIHTIMHFVITGYVASNTHGVATTLQRDGSDYSAAIMGRLLESCNITIWTDVDGVLSADPRRVPDSYILPEVSFTEVTELAFFGAKVIHPKTMQPAIMEHPQIPIYIRNTFNSSFRGSRIFTSSTTHTDKEKCVCGFSSIENMAIVNVEGSGMVGVKGVAGRLFGTLEGMGVNVVLISQASSEYSITFATNMVQANVAKGAIEEEFHKEIKQNHISTIDVVAPCSIIAAVGDGMRLNTGVAGRFFSALGDAKINVLAISQGSSERNMSAVVLESESTRALRAIHAAFRLSHTNVRVGVVGMSEVGESLLKMLGAQRQKLKTAFEIDLQVCAILKDGKTSDIVVLKNQLGGVDADSITAAEYNDLVVGTGMGMGMGGSLLLGAPAAAADGTAALSMIFDEKAKSSKQISAKVVQGGLEHLATHVFSGDNAHSIIFDCTGDVSVGEKHADWLTMGIHIVTANNTALSGSKIVIDAIKKAERSSRKVHYLREIAVGGGLPIVSTLRDVHRSGDHIRRIDGILSVSMSYIMHRIAPPPGVYECSAFDEKITMGAYRDDKSMSPAANQRAACSFSQAVKEATGLGLMEEDPLKDPDNEYTARCLMVLARELGMDQDYDVSKIQARSDSLADGGKRTYSEMEAEISARMKSRVEAAAAKGCVPRHVFSVDVKRKVISINIVDVPFTHIFATTAPSCECVRFFTERHKTYPLIVQGPSAGADSTASFVGRSSNMMKHKVGTNSGIISRSASSSFWSRLNNCWIVRGSWMLYV